MQCEKLSDADLWRAITQNTDEFSALLSYVEADDIGIAGPRCSGSSPYYEVVNKFECEYRECVTELRRRHHCLKKSNSLNREWKWFLARLVRGVTPAGFVQYGLAAAFISVIIVAALRLHVH
jgi:hypothetical protein